MKFHCIVNEKPLCPVKLVNGDPWRRYYFSPPGEFKYMDEERHCTTCKHKLKESIDRYLTD